MSSEIDSSSRPIRSLVYYCRRVASIHVDGIVSLGDTVSFELVQPILESCSADNLRRLEDATPHLRSCTNDLWRQQCFREHPTEAEEYSSEPSVPPKLWRDLFFDLRARKEKRLQEMGARMKSQQLELEERKRQKEIKILDRPPPMKRARGWSSTPQQKSLFQKTRSEASKIQRTMYEPRMRPPMPAAQTNRARIRNVVQQSSSPSQPTSGTRVVVRPAVCRPSPKMLPASTPPVAEKKTTTPLVQKSSPVKDSQRLESPPRLKQSSLNAKKDPACSLFMPKHRAHSQLTSRMAPCGSPTK